MKTEKLSLNGIKNVLSRAEMKKIMAGSSPQPNCCWCNNGTVQPVGGSSEHDDEGCALVCAANHLSGGLYIPTRCSNYP